MFRVQIRGTLRRSPSGQPRFFASFVGLSSCEAERRRLASRQLASTTRDRMKVVLHRSAARHATGAADGAYKTAVVRLNMR